jgi:hypothetical protein
MLRASVLALILVHSLSANVRGQELFESNTVLSLKIECYFDSLFQFFRYERNFQKTTITVDNRDFPAKMRVRGNSRRTEDFCYFPPLLLKFKPKDIKGTPFESEKRLKLVTPCLQNLEEGVELISREYIVYRFYNEITNFSFQVKPLSVEYRDINSGRQQETGSFLIERDEKMAERLGYELLDDLVYREETPDYLNSTRLSLFQFMIGNVDWFYPNHNLKIMTNGSDTIAVPYDFDLSGFVNAPYAEPRSSYYQNSVRDRYYMGQCRSRDTMEQELNFFREKEKAFYHIIQEASWLSPEIRTDLEEYLQSFYVLIGDPEKVENTILSTCSSIY